tara:strand:+ start:2597 stop:3127 length:531 start_codon:yes stop_codon:yes gene_type:complete
MKMISEEYAKLLEWEHANTPGEWGHTAEMYVPVIVSHCEQFTDWLDYGAGSGGLGKTVSKLYGNKYSITEYEPSRPNTVAPGVHDYVVCIDVLEHVEPELIDNVLDDLQRVTGKKGYFTISCRPATKILKDGRNAHILIKPKEWWKEKLEPRFKIIEEGWDPSDRNYKVVVYARQQ